ncbi:hypothetical protein FJZ36_13645 [Candidatus Poribacteria bacterium]|nr:hypothetical protein [Candidatus Poribacteria bacterium]
MHRSGSPYIDGFGRILLGDFWEWAFSDLDDEAVRSRFAEFVVRRLLGLLGGRSPDPSQGGIIEWGGRRIAVRGSEGSPWTGDVDAVVRCTIPERDPTDLAGWSFAVSVPNDPRTSADPGAMEAGVTDYAGLAEAIRRAGARG